MSRKNNIQKVTAQTVGSEDALLTYDDTEGRNDKMTDYAVYVTNNHASNVIQAKLQWSPDEGSTWIDVDPSTGYQDVGTTSTVLIESGSLPLTHLRILAQEKVSSSPSDDVDAYLLIREDQ